MSEDIFFKQIDHRYKELENDAKKSGYFLNSDREFTKGLVEGLLMNATRYGYESCPCRLSMGEKKDDLDIICPCDYRDEDLAEFGACFCGLYVTEDVAKNYQPAPIVPERRPTLKDRVTRPNLRSSGSLPYPVYRCKVCGYLCARTSPPEKCPICKVDKERFEIFLQ